MQQGQAVPSEPSRAQPAQVAAEGRRPLDAQPPAAPAVLALARARPAWLRRALALNAVGAASFTAAAVMAGVALGLPAEAGPRALLWAPLLVPVFASLLLFDLVWSRYLHGDHVRLRLGHLPMPARALAGRRLRRFHGAMRRRDAHAVARELDHLVGRVDRPPLDEAACALAPQPSDDGSRDHVMRAVPGAWWAALVLWALAWSASSGPDATAAVAGAASATMLAVAATALRVRTRWRRAELDAWVSWYAVHRELVTGPGSPVPRVAALQGSGLAAGAGEASRA